MPHLFQQGDQPWTNVTLVNAPGADSYPIASFSYLLLYKELTTNPSLKDQNKAQNLVDFINWAVTDGQQFAPDLAYVPLPDPVVPTFSRDFKRTNIQWCSIASWLESEKVTK